MKAINIFFALPDKAGLARVWLCLIYSGGRQIKIGMAICGMDDEPNDAFGATIAYRRALRAQKDGAKSKRPIAHPKAVETMLNCIDGTKFLKFKSLDVPIANVLSNGWPKISKSVLHTVGHARDELQHNSYFFVNEKFVLAFDDMDALTYVFGKRFNLENFTQAFGRAAR